MKTWSLLFLGLALSAAKAVHAQTSSGEELALGLRTNVVRIVAHVGVGAPPRQGFGFVVAEDSGQLYIVTADHVVRGDDPGEVDKRPTIIFFQDPGKEYSGELLGTELLQREGDLAVVRIQVPARFTWNRNAAATDSARRDLEVWFVGRLGEWDVPTRGGAVNRIEPNGDIRVDALPVSVGTSGAPLISQNGILGMIVIDAGPFSVVTPLEVIRRAFENWNYPWQLAAVGLQPPKPQAPMPPSSGSGERLISVWKVGSPHRDDTPDATVPLDLELSAAKIGRKLTIKAFPAKGFAATLIDAFSKNQEPDILAIDNYGIIDGITTLLGTFAGIGSNDLVRQKLVKVTESLKGFEGAGGGWEFLFSTSKNYQAAKLLALRSPECNSPSQLLSLPRDIQAFVGRAGWAYLQGARSVEPFEDSDRLRTDSTTPRELQISDAKECGYAGNDQLALVSMVFSYESAQALGRIPVVLILRKQQSAWQLLAASTDPVSNIGLAQEIPKLAGILHAASGADKKPAPAKLLSPEDGQAPLPDAGQRFGDFTWQTSVSTNVVAEVIEFAYKNDARLFVRFIQEGSRSSERLSAGQLWTTKTIWKWRVWSISNTGAVSFSESRSFPH